MRRCLGTDYWLPRCLAGGGREPFQAPGAVRRDSSPSKTPHLQVWAPLTRPDRRRRGGRSLSRPRRSSGFLSWGFKDAPPSISARCVRSRRGPPRGGPPSAEEMPSPQRLPPLPFFPASTVCSAARLAGLCASRVLADAVLRQRRPAPRGVSPATDHGVHAVSAPAAMPAVVDPLGTLVSLSADPQGSPAGRPRSQMLPRSCPTLRSFVPRQQPSRPSPVGGALSPLQAAAPVVVWLRTTSRLRWRLPTSGPLSAAESGARRCCCQHVRPDAPLGLILKRAGGVLPREPSGEAVRVRDRIGGPGRARARSASRPNSDFGVDASLPSPDPEDRARVGPTRGSPPRSEGAGRARPQVVRRRRTFAPVSHSAQRQPAVPKRSKPLSLSLVTRSAIPA